MPTADDKEIFEEQIAYYEARAGEYDNWLLRKGRYDRGPESNEKFFTELNEVREQIGLFNPTGNVLELACGTGWGTELLVEYADHITAVDSSEEVLALNRNKVSSDKVHYVQSDIFQWQTKKYFDVIFFSFWLSHVPPGRFTEFWDKVQSALKPGGRVFFADTLASRSSAAKNHSLFQNDESISLRYLDDGREFQIIKIFYDPEKLTARLNELGWGVSVKSTETHFLYGSGEVQ